MSHGSLEGYAPALKRYFRRYLNQADADDLVQEVYVGMQARRAEAPIENVEGYIFRVAANVLHRYRQRGAVNQRTFTDMTAATVSASDSPSVERLLISREDLRSALTIIQELSPRTRDVFVLHRFEELSYNAIATRLGVSVSAVEKHIMLALRALSKLRSECR